MTDLLRRLWTLLLAHRWRVVLLFGGVLLPLYTFGEFADEVLEKEGFDFDHPVLHLAREPSSPVLDNLMVTMSHLGYEWGVVPLSIGIALLLVARRARRDLLFFTLSVGGAALLNRLAKLFFGRERPSLWESIAPEPDTSFPSGHAMASMAFVVAVVVLLWPTRWRYPAMILGALFVLLVSFSRIYLGVHYPSDILAGWCASFAWVMGLSGIFYRRFGKPDSSEITSSETSSTLATASEPTTQREPA